jgi:DNA repair protein RadB
MENKITSGSEVIDTLLNGGYEKDVINCVYGPAGSGKTLFCLLCAISVAKSGKKVIYFDTEGGFSVERLEQLTKDYEDILNRVVFFRPISFEEQKKAFEKLKHVINDKTGLIVVDTVSMLYRLELGQTDDIYEVNRELGQQISFLGEIARKKGILVLITNQVYSDFENKGNVKMVGGDILKYGAKCLIELKKLHGGKIVALLKKHRSIAENKKVFLKIVNEGIAPVEEGKGIRF